jgi:Domain of unknown function (DUF4178)
MSRNNLIKSVNCTSCGAGLDILGGGRVIVHVCSYCGSSLDAQDNYRLLKKLGNIKRPSSPFKIGMIGNIQGVDFTIIGTLGLVERYAGNTWRWVDHQLYSATHGYAFLTVEDGHFVFTRRYRKSTSSNWISSYGVERAEYRPTVMSDGDRYEYYETSTSEVTFAEGEFNWQPELGESQTTVSMLSDQAMLSFTETKTEREVERSIYLEHDQTLSAFGAENAFLPSGVHPLQPFKAGKNAFFLKWVGLGCAAVSLVLVLILFGLSNGRTTASERLQATSLPIEIPVDIKTKDRLARIQVSGDVNNSWAYVGFSLMDPEDEPVFEAGREIERYSGKDSEGYWSEGSGSASLRFIPRQIGTYTLEIAIEEAGTWQRDGSSLTKLSVKVDEAISSPYYMVLLTAAFLIVAAVPIARSRLHHRRRWWGSDWVDEDDD